MKNNFTYREGDKILQELITLESKEEKLELSNHFKKRAKLRGISIDYAKKMILNEEPLGLLSSRDNRFKVFYPGEHEDDLVVVIAIEDDYKVIGVTVYEDKISKREGIK